MEIRSKVLAVIAPVCVPLMIVTVYLVATRAAFEKFSGASDYVAIFVSVIIGLGCIVSSPWSKNAKSIVSLFYFPAYTVVTMGYMFVFVCHFFQDCL